MREAKKEKTPPAATEDAPRRRNRRQAIALAGAAAAAATVAALGMEGGKKAHAGPGDNFILGQGNDGGTQTTSLEAAPGPDEPASTLDLQNRTMPVGDDERARALKASSYGEAIMGTTHGNPEESPATGVLGLSQLADTPPGVVIYGPAPGVHGISGTGPGVRGRSQSGPGVEGRSLSGPGLSAYSESGPGAGGDSASGPGVLGQSPGPGGGVLGLAPADAPAVHAYSGWYPAKGVPPTPDGGLALDVVGKARFSTAGAGIVRARREAATVENPAVTADSHITVTFTGDPGAASVAWVERQPGTGFIARLSSRPRWDVPFTYLIVEPGV